MRMYPRVKEILDNQVFIIEAGMPGKYTDKFGNDKTLEDWKNSPGISCFLAIPEHLIDEYKSLLRLIVYQTLAAMEKRE